MRRRHTSGKNEGGYVLAFSLVVTTILLVGAAGLLTLRSQRAVSSSRKVQQIYARVAIHNATVGFSRQAAIDLASGSLSAAGMSSPPYITDPADYFDTATPISFGTTTNSVTGTTLIPSHLRGGISSISSTNADPLNLMQARVNTFTLEMTATLSSTAALPEGDMALPMIQDITATVREVPVSEFNLYSAGALGINAGSYDGSNLGRVRANGDITFLSGYSVVNWLPLAAAGDINFSTGTSVSDGGAHTLSTSSSTVAPGVWTSQTAGPQDFAFLTRYDDIHPLIQGLSTLATLTGTSDTDTRSLHVQCAVKGSCDSTGALTVPGPLSAAFRAFPTAIPPTLMFDYEAAYVASGGAAMPSIYLAAPAGWQVAIYHAHTLHSGFSVVSPNPILVIGGFNDTGALQPASLITTDRLFTLTDTDGDTLWGPP